MLRAQLRDRAFTYPWHAVPDGQYPRPSQFGEAPRMPICCKSTTVRGFIGSNMILRALPSLLAGAPILMLDNQAPPHYSPRPSAIHGCNPKVCAGPGSGHRAVLTNPVRCCNAFAHTSTSPTSLDPRCSAIGPEPEAPDNSQAIDAGQVAASIHRMHHSNERPVGGAKSGHAEESVSAAGTALSQYYLLPPHACSRVKLLAPGPPTCYPGTSVPPDHLQRNNEENRSRTARGCHVVPVDICAKANWPLDKLPNGN